MGTSNSVSTYTMVTPIKFSLLGTRTTILSITPVRNVGTTVNFLHSQFQVQRSLNSPSKRLSCSVSLHAQCHCLAGIFPTQGSNPGLLHCWKILYCLSQQGSPKYDLIIPSLGIIQPREMKIGLYQSLYKNVHSSTTSDSEEVETTQMCTNW